MNHDGPDHCACCKTKFNPSLMLRENFGLYCDKLHYFEPETLLDHGIDNAESLTFCSTECLDAYSHQCSREEQIEDDLHGMKYSCWEVEGEEE